MASPWLNYIPLEDIPLPKDQPAAYTNKPIPLMRIRAKRGSKRLKRAAKTINQIPVATPYEYLNYVEALATTPTMNSSKFQPPAPVPNPWNNVAYTFFIPPPPLPPPKFVDSSTPSTPPPPPPSYSPIPPPPLEDSLGSRIDQICEIFALKGKKMMDNSYSRNKVRPPVDCNFFQTGSMSPTTYLEGNYGDENFFEPISPSTSSIKSASPTGSLENVANFEPAARRAIPIVTNLDLANYKIPKKSSSTPLNRPQDFQKAGYCSSQSSSSNSPASPRDVSPRKRKITKKSDESSSSSSENMIPLGTKKSQLSPGEKTLKAALNKFKVPAFSKPLEKKPKMTTNISSQKKPSLEKPKTASGSERMKAAPKKKTSPKSSKKEESPINLEAKSREIFKNMSEVEILACCKFELERLKKTAKDQPAKKEPTSEKKSPTIPKISNKLNKISKSPKISLPNNWDNIRQQLEERNRKLAEEFEKRNTNLQMANKHLTNEEREKLADQTSRSRELKKKESPQIQKEIKKSPEENTKTEESRDIIKSLQDMVYLPVSDLSYNWEKEKPFGRLD